MKSGAIATPHDGATRAGMNAYANGGNAIDAALAAAAVLTVVYPHQCTIGGDVFALVHTRYGETHSINGSGVLPLSVDVDELRKQGSEVPAHGINSITVPGAVAGWNAISELGGNLAISEILSEAIEAAENGTEVSSSLAAGINSQFEVLKQDPGISEIFMPGGTPLGTGSVLRQPALAKTLQSLSEDGLDSFYRGYTAERLVRGLADLGSGINSDDLVGHQTETTDPIKYIHNGIEFLTSPPNSQGFVLLETIAALDAISIPLDLAGKNARYVLCASLIAANDRERYLGDPRHSDIPLKELLEPGVLKSKMDKLLDSGASFLDMLTARPAKGDTVAICTMDDDGNAVSLIQSGYQTFGSGILEKQTGVIMHNRARGFSLRPGAANEMIPGMKPAHTLMPLLYSIDGRITASLGTMGGRAQPQILLQILAGAVDSKSSISEILSSPRWVFGGRDIGFDTLTVAIEADDDKELHKMFKIKDLDIARVKSRDERMGHANMVRLLSNGELESGSDPRSNGLGQVYSEYSRSEHARGS